MAERRRKRVISSTSSYGTVRESIWYLLAGREARARKRRKGTGFLIEKRGKGGSLLIQEVTNKYKAHWRAPLAIQWEYVFTYMYYIA